MAELGLLVNIMTKVDKALADIDKVKNKIEKMASEGQKQTDRATLSTKRFGASLAMVGATAGLAFNSIVEASPSMQMALITTNIYLENMWREIGENLAPIIQDVLLPIISDFTEAVIALDPEIQLWIGATIGITVVIVALAAAVAALSFVSIPLVGTLLLLGGAIAFVILSSNGYLDGLAEKTGEWQDALEILIVVGKFIGGLFTFAFQMLIGGALAAWEGFKTSFQGITQIVTGFFDFFKNAWFAIVAFVKGDDAGFQNAIEGILSGLKKFLAGIANFIIGIVKFAVLAIMNIAKAITNALKIDTPKLDAAITKVQGWGIDTSTFHEGGKVGGPRDVMAWLKPKETVRTETQESALQNQMNQRGGGGRQKVIVNINLSNVAFNERRDIDRLAIEVEKRFTKSQFSRGYT